MPCSLVADAEAEASAIGLSATGDATVLLVGEALAGDSDASAGDWAGSDGGAADSGAEADGVGVTAGANAPLQLPRTRCPSAGRSSVPVASRVRKPSQ